MVAGGGGALGAGLGHSGHGASQVAGQVGAQQGHGGYRAPTLHTAGAHGQGGCRLRTQWAQRPTQGGRVGQRPGRRAGTWEMQAMRAGGSAPLHFSDGQTEGLGGWDLPSPPAQARACLPPRRTGMGGPRGAAHGPGRSLEVLPPSYELWASSLCPPGLGPLGPQSFRPGNRFVEKAAAGVASDAVCFHRS